MLIGVTGKYCAGKSTVSQIFIDQGFKYINVDTIGHEALVALKNDVVAHFGDGILGKDGNIDRAMLGKIVFASEDKLLVLESIVHPWMIAQVSKRIAQEKECNFIIDAALLYHMKLQAICDYVIIVHTNICIRAIRARKRDKLVYREILQRFRSQKEIPDKYFYKKNKKKLLNHSRKYSEYLVVGAYPVRVVQAKIEEILRIVYGTKDRL